MNTFVCNILLYIEKTFYSNNNGLLTLLSSLMSSAAFKFTHILYNRYQVLKVNVLSKLFEHVLF